MPKLSDEQLDHLNNMARHFAKLESDRLDTDYIPVSPVHPMDPNMAPDSTNYWRHVAFTLGGRCSTC